MGADSRWWPPRARVAAIVLTVVLAGCAPPALDRDQAAEERRTCASLRERVTARALERVGLLDVPERAKTDDLDPEALATDETRYYAALEWRLAEAGFGPRDGPTAVSPAARVVEQCRRLVP